MIEIGIKRNIAPLCGKCKTPLECKSEDDNPHDAESNILVYVEPCPCTGLIGNSMMGQAVMDEANNEILRLRKSVRYWSDRSDDHEAWAQKWGTLHDERLEEYRAAMSKNGLLGVELETLRDELFVTRTKAAKYDNERALELRRLRKGIAQAVCPSCIGSGQTCEVGQTSICVDCYIAATKRLARLEAENEKWWSAMRAMYKVTEGADIDTLHEHIEPECYEHDYKYERG